MDQADCEAGGPGGGAGGKNIPPGSERRRFARFTVLDHRGWLGRWSGRGFEVVEVLLLDLSRGGALLETEELPTQHQRQTSLLGLEALREEWCLEVRVVRVCWGRRRRYRVHVAFTESCPDAFYAAALHGPGPRGAAGFGPLPPDALIHGTGFPPVTGPLPPPRPVAAREPDAAEEH